MKFQEFNPKILGSFTIIKAFQKSFIMFRLAGKNWDQALELFIHTVRLMF